MNGNFNIQAFQRNQEEHQNAFQEAERPHIEEDPMPNFSAEAIIEAEDDQQMALICNFTCEEFMTLYSVVQNSLEIIHRGGRRGYYSPMTIFLITLSYLKSAMDFPQLQIQFGFTDTYMSILINVTVNVCAPILLNWAVRWIPMEENVQKYAFQIFPKLYCCS